MAKLKSKQPDCVVTLEHDYEPVTDWYYKNERISTVQHRVSRCTACGAEVLELRDVSDA